ncbi:MULTISPECIES: lysophospholipid acyltransferase family protein [unclassified Acinetobacter]|uniref:lysophospholipid acyltransferase family protein n=1 Tax=unclassified Acinetobacter TaxID=196816 RepID=UPI002575B56E|nr:MULTISPECIES: lysophospholipid acyltransferase family protein [unclassified Acinetobacter]MDM1764633.1 acyltransferase family protein [Acinetobacter sp. 226-1]MDM1768629.1 acyltransferase family protein [Acinetobacter sp. 226-4]
MVKKQLEIKHNSKLLRAISALQRFYFRPTFLGAEHLNPQKPAMYVGNHTIYGVLDSPILIDYLYNEHKIAIVSLADHMHFHIPVWKEVVKRVGGVDGVQAYAKQAMQQGYSILVFPGGGREVIKRKGEAYQLIWKQRYGFLKLAQEFGYDIAPFVALGGDEVFELGFDVNMLLKQKWFNKILSNPKIGSFLRNGEVIPSIPKHIIPKRIPFYFKFMPRLSIDQIENMEDMIQFRDDLQQLIYAEIEALKVYRESDCK